MKRSEDLNVCTDPKCEYHRVPSPAHMHSAAGVAFSQPVDVRWFTTDGHVVEQAPTGDPTHLTPAVVSR